MKTITKEYLKKEIERMKESNSIINSAAESSPFGNAINLEEKANEFMQNAEERIRVEIWQKHRIRVLEGLLKELE